MKHWRTSGNLQEMPPQSKLKQLFKTLPPVAKTHFNTLSRIDHKLHAARRIEEVLASHGLTIGLEGGTKTNITISIHDSTKKPELISSILAGKISKISTTDMATKS